MASSPDTMPTTYESRQTTETRQTTLDKSYITSLPGILRIAELVLDFILFICACATLVGASGFVVFITITLFITTALFFIFRLLTLYSRLPQSIPWTLVEFVHYAIACLLMLIAAIIMAVFAPFIAAAGAGAFFAFVALVVYGVDCFFCFQRWRSGEPPAPDVTTSTTVTTVETTAHY